MVAVIDKARHRFGYRFRIEKDRTTNLRHRPAKPCL
jgi:hypothetical protein